MMDQPKFSIGPYELFSSIIAGVPLLLAVVLIYRPISGLRDLIPTIRDSSTIPVAVTFILTVYILGGLSSFEQIMLPLISLVLCLSAFRRAVSFRRWRYREILISFYHLAGGEQQSQNNCTNGSPEAVSQKNLERI